MCFGSRDGKGINCPGYKLKVFEVKRENGVLLAPRWRRKIRFIWSPCRSRSRASLDQPQDHVQHHAGDRISTSTANIEARSRPKLACRISTPMPALAPTNSPTMAPMTDKHDAAMLRPAKM